MNALLCLILTVAALSPAPEITGTIVDDHGKLSSGIPLSIVSLPSDQVVESTRSAPDGSFTVTDLHPGSYGVEAKTDSACAFSDAIQVHAGFTSVVRLRLVKGLCSGAFAR